MTVRTLYHHPLSPTCRKIRIALAEKGFNCNLLARDFICTDSAFLKLNPTGEVPVFIDNDGTVVPDHSVICEYLEEAYPDTHLLGTTIPEKIEVRRLMRFFDEKFSREVSSVLLFEKIIKSLKGLTPDAGKIRKGKDYLRKHLKYVEWLILRRGGLAGKDLSYADIAAAAHISVIDYLGDIDWDKWPDVKDWYSRIKSRRSFKGILGDRQPGFTPPPYYSELDF